MADDDDWLEVFNEDEKKTTKPAGEANRSVFGTNLNVESFHEASGPTTDNCNEHRELDLCVNTSSSSSTVTTTEGNSHETNYNSNSSDSNSSNSNSNEPNGNVNTPSKNEREKLTKRFCKRLVKEFVIRFSRGFGSGVGVYAGIRIVTALLKNPFRKSLPGVFYSLFTRDCCRVASFFGLFPSVYHLMIDILKYCRSQHDGWTYGISGGVAGLTVAILDQTRRETLTFFTLSRALGAVLSTLATRNIIPTVPFFETAAFCVCTSLVVYCFALKPHYLTPGYYRSILKWSRDLTDENLTLRFRQPADHLVTCEEAGIHSGSCVRHRLSDMMRSLPSFAKLYLPIHLTPILVFKRKLLLEKPGYVLQSLAKNLIRSSAFLGIMCSTAKLAACLLINARSIPQPVPGYVPALCGALCGLALLLERYSRRKELALFLIPHTLGIIYGVVQRSRFKSLLKVPHGFTLTFALSMTSVMHAFEREPESLTLLITGVLRFFVGRSTIQDKKEKPKVLTEQEVQAKPSN